MLFLSSTAFILMWFDISILVFLKFIVLGVNNIYDIGYVGSESVFNEFIAHHDFNKDDDGKFSCRSCYYSGFSYFVLENYVTDLQFRVDYYNGKLEGRTYIADSQSFSDWKEFTFKLP